MIEINDKVQVVRTDGSLGATGVVKSIGRPNKDDNPAVTVIGEDGWKFTTRLKTLKRI